MNPDFFDMLREFNDARVDYLLVGAYAVAVHGAPRATADIDLWVRASADNAERVYKALAKFGAPLQAVSPSDFAVTGTIFQIGVKPNRIDVITGLAGLTFDEAWPTRTQVQIEGLTVPVIGRAELIRNKLAAGRPKDLADVALLDEAGPPTD